MSGDEFSIKLSRDQALVLSGWLYRMIDDAGFDEMVNRDRAVWSPLYRIAGTLETTLAEIFAPDCTARLAAARERLPATLGDPDEG